MSADSELLEKVDDALNKAFNNETDFAEIIDIRDDFREFILKYEDIERARKIQNEYI